MRFKALGDISCKIPIGTHPSNFRNRCHYGLSNLEPVGLGFIKLAISCLVIPIIPIIGAKISILNLGKEYKCPRAIF